MSRWQHGKRGCAGWSTCCKSSSRQCARHGQPSCRGTASRTRYGTGCIPCACIPGFSQSAACTWGRAWCWPGSSWRFHSLHCSCVTTCSLLHSPPGQQSPQSVSHVKIPASHIAQSLFLYCHLSQQYRPVGIEGDFAELAVHINASAGCLLAVRTSS